jgi:hypothetical protein
MRASIFGYVLVATTVFAAPVCAQDLGGGAHAMPTSEYRLTARWDTGLFTGAHSETSILGTGAFGGTSWSSVFSAQLDARDWVVGLAVPLAFMHDYVTATAGGITSTTNDDQAELGNIEVEGYVNVDLGSPEHRLLVGGGVALPTATDQLSEAGMPRRILTGNLVRQAAWHSMFRNAAAWADQSFGLWATASYRFASEWVLVQASGSIPLFFPTHGRYGSTVLGQVFPGDGNTPVGRGNVEMMLSLDAYGAIRIANVIDAGVSFLAWALPSGTGVMNQPDLGQTALALSVRTDDALDFPIGGGFEWIIDLDDAWGPTGGDRRMWGAHLYVYGRFDLGESRAPAGEHHAAPAAAPADTSSTPSWE